MKLTASEKVDRMGSEVSDMINPIIEFCINNLANGAQRVYEVMEKDPNLDVVEYGCLGYCGKCDDSLIALVNGEIISAETPEALIENIYNYLDENPMF